MEFEKTVEIAGKTADACGVAVIMIGLAVATAIFATRLWRGADRTGLYSEYRQGVGRAMLLGLEILVAADIIRTVALTPTFESAGVLAIIVLIRTFLSLSLQVELEGRLPWQPQAKAEN